MQKNILMSLIKRYDGCQENLAKAMDKSLSTLSAKINEYNGRSFTVKEMRFLKDRYNMTDEDFISIFFTD